MNAVSNIYESLFKGCFFLRHDLLQDKKDYLFTLFSFLYFTTASWENSLLYIG